MSNLLRKGEGYEWSMKKIFSYTRREDPYEPTHQGHTHTNTLYFLVKYLLTPRSALVLSAKSERIDKQAVPMRHTRPLKHGQFAL